MQTETKPSWISPNFIQAIKDPIPDGINSTLFFGRSFDFLPKEEKESIIQQNQYALVARRVAKWLSDLKPSKNENGKSFDCYGTVVNFAAHVLTAKMFECLNVSEASPYIERVEQEKREFISIIKEKGAVTLKEINFKKSLDHLDIPGNHMAKSISLDNQKIIQEFSEALEKKFKLTIISRNETTSGTSLRAKTDSETEQNMIDLAKKMLSESGLIDSFKTLQLLEEAICMVIEGHELYSWVEEQSQQHTFTDEELFVLKNKTVNGIKQAATQVVFDKALHRLNQLVKENPDFPLTAQEFAAFFIQDFYPRFMGFKVVVEADPINQTRQKICPGIKPVKFPRITLIGVQLPEVEPLEGLPSKEQTNLIALLKFVQKQTEDSTIGFILDLLKRDMMTRKIQTYIQKR